MNNGRNIVVTLVGIVLLLLGLALGAGGIYLITLGGSWFYLPAGLRLRSVELV